MYQSIHEFQDPPDAYVRKLGWGSVRLMALGSVSANPGFLVRLYKSGMVRWVDMLDLRVSENPGDPRDGIDIPEDWIAGRAVGKPSKPVTIDPTDHAVPVRDTKVFAVDCEPPTDRSE